MNNKPASAKYIHFSCNLDTDMITDLHKIISFVKDKENKTVSFFGAIVIAVKAFNKHIELNGFDKPDSLDNTGEQKITNPHIGVH